MAKVVFFLFLCSISQGIWGQGLDDAMRFSSTGILVQKMRLSIIAQNLANLTTLKVEETGLPYQKQYAVVKSSPNGVRISSIEKSTEPFAKYFDEAVPQSDENGFFYYPNVNLPDEMMNMTYTEAIYEANIAAFKTTKALYQSAIDALK
jgi:flagellar basal-body rod protein FlgC